MSRLAITWLITMTAILALAGCGDSPDQKSCPEKGKEFFRESVSHYFKNHPSAEGVDRVEVLEGAVYDERTKWWVVPVDVGSKKWNALLSCDGHLELSGRPDK